MMNVEHITWIDSASGLSTWSLLEDIDKADLEPTDISTVGFVIKETVEYIVVALNFGNNPPQYSNTITIPISAITSREKIFEYKMKGEQQ